MLKTDAARWKSAVAYWLNIVVSVLYSLLYIVRRYFPPMSKAKVRFVYAGIRVRSLNRSLKFYQSIGFRIKKRGRMQHGGQWVELSFPGSSLLIELNYYPKGNPFYEPFRDGTHFDHWGFQVSSISKWEALLRKLKLPIVARITEGRTKLIFTKDPDGNWLEFSGR
ncbi:MAG: VOC family protein [Methanomassiliicoccales archaeon]